MQEYDALARELAAAPTPRAKDMVESRLKAIEKRIGQVDKQIDQYSPTGPVKEYAFAMTQRQAQGLPIVPFEKWDPAADRKAAVGPSADDVSGLRKEVQGLPSYKNVAQAAPVYRSMLDAAGRDDRASDVNLIYGMAKLMDPGSVVRESEMTVAQAIATLPQQIQNSIKSQFTQTGRLSQDVREGLMREAYSRMSSYNQLFDQDAGMYRGIVGRRGMNEADVLPSFGEFKPYQRPEKPGASAGNAPKAGAVEDGFRFKGGNPADPSSWEKAN